MSPSVLGSSSIQAPHGCLSSSAILPSLPVWLNDSLSHFHGKSGPDSYLFCSFCWPTQNRFPPPFTIFLCCLEFQRFGLPYPSIPSSKWIKSLGHEAALEVRYVNTQKYPKYTGIPSPSAASCFSTTKEASLFTLFSAPLFQPEDIFTTHIPQHTAWGLFWGRTKEITSSKWCTVQFWSQGN